MRILVDLNRCELYAQCCFLAPQVFRIEGEAALAYHPEPGEELRERVARAAAACPVLAIMVELDEPESVP
jgi:ferredoxin